MNKYYSTEPDAGTYFVSISDLTESQIKYISDHFGEIEDEDEKYEEYGYKFKYATEVPCGFYDPEGNKFDELLDYLHNEGFKDLCDIILLNKNISIK